MTVRRTQMGVLQFLPRRNRASRVPVFYQPPFDRARLRVLKPSCAMKRAETVFVTTASFITT
jgi:hypothetical protein